MCGRYAIAVPDAAVLRERFAVQQGLETWTPSQNLKPTQAAPVVVIRNDARELTVMRWGLIPTWAKDAKIGNNMFNARAETVADKPSFRAAFRRRRCLIPATGFYEWRQEDRRNVPYEFFVDDGEVFAFAGLYEAWRDPRGETLWSYTIITTTPNELVAPIHNRMPVILPYEHESLWLDPQFEDVTHLQSLLAAYPADRMRMRPVDRAL